MDKFTLKRDNDRDLSVSGILIADVSGKRDNSPMWSELRLYRAESGKYVFARDKMSSLAGARNTHEAVILDSARDLVDYLAEDGLGRLDKELLEAAAKDDPAIAAAMVEDVK